jgi:hypothetical protein
MGQVALLVQDPTIQAQAEPAQAGRAPLLVRYAVKVQQQRQLNTSASLGDCCASEA